MPILIKEFEASSDEMWACSDRLIPWLRDTIGKEVICSHALQGLDPSKLECMKLDYRKVRGTPWKYDHNVVGLTHYVGERWQLFVGYSMENEKQEFIIQLDHDIDAIQCKLAVL
jgi:hypothetical protein